MKKFVRKTRGMTLMKCAEEYIKNGDTPLISIQGLQESNKYKEVDKFLLEQGYKKVFQDKEVKDRFITPAHYEYIK